MLDGNVRIYQARLSVEGPANRVLSIPRFCCPIHEQTFDSLLVLFSVLGKVGTGETWDGHMECDFKGTGRIEELVCLTDPLRNYDLDPAFS